MSTSVNTLDLEVCGVTLPVRRVVDEKYGSVYWTVYKQGTKPWSAKRTGIAISPLDLDLPSNVTIEGSNVPLSDITSVPVYERDASGKTRKTGAFADVPPGTKREGEALITVEGEQRRCQIKLSQRKDDLWNIKVVVNQKGVRTAGPRSGVSLADL